MKKILFVIPRIFANYPGALNPHLGVAYMMSFLEQNGVSADVFDMQLGYDFKQLLDKVEKTKPDIIGVSLFSFDFINSYKLIDKIKTVTKLPVILGGCHISSVLSKVLEDTKADLASYGEAEDTILDVCQENDLKEIKGLIYRDGAKVVLNSPRELRTDLDVLPFPDYERFELSKYNFTIDKRLPIVTARGCPYRCAYCAAYLTVGRNFRVRSPENVVAEMKHWHSKGFNSFEIVDDCFNFDMDRAKKLCDMIVNSDFEIKLRFGSGIRADRVDAELLAKMKKAGTVYLAYGLESGNQETLKNMKKALTLATAWKAFELTAEAGITFSVNFIVGHVKETYDQAMDSIKYAKKIAKAFPKSYINFHNMVPIPGTELNEYVRAHGTFTLPEEKVLTEAATLSGNPLFETPEFSLEQRRKVLKLGLKLTRKTHLICRFGKFKGKIVYAIFGNSFMYGLGRKFVMGSGLGRRLFNVIKKRK